MRRFRGPSCILAALAIAALLSPAGCIPKQRGAPMYYTQAQTAGRSIAAGAMAAEWRAKTLKLDDCIDLAFEHIDKEGDAASLVFAGAVLDFAELVEKDLPRAGEMELFWMRVGGLACAAGEKAYNAKDIKLARSLILAGPARWKSDAYWMRRPNHDAIASYVLYLSGEGGEAIRRLRSRPDLDAVQQRAIDEIQAAMRGGQ
jgi:hypothetical protein